VSHKDDLLTAMREARAHLERAVGAYQGRLDTEFADGWRLREVLAHVALWERMATRKLSGVPLPDGEDLANRKPWNLDAFNDGMRERWRGRSDEEILIEFAAAHEALVAAVAASSEEECAPGGKAWRAVDEDGAGHYHHHFPIPDVMAARWPQETGIARN
jgi:hypothetical protein